MGKNNRSTNPQFNQRHKMKLTFKHGSGFWDRDGLPDSTSKDLTDAAHAFGEKDIYAGDDGRLYFS
jgi:hypothetical protein